MIGTFRWRARVTRRLGGGLLLGSAVLGCASLLGCAAGQALAQANALALPASGAATGAEQARALAGNWVGGFSLGAEAGEPMLVVDFGAGRAVSSQSGLNTGLLGATRLGDDVRFELALDGGVTAFSGRIAPAGAMRGVVERGAERGIFELRKARPFDPVAFMQEAMGVFVDPSAHGAIRLSAWDSFASFFDLSSGAMRALFPLADQTYALGPGMGTAFPWQQTLTLRRDEQGKVRSVVISASNGAPRLFERIPSTSEEVAIQNQGVTLAGTLYQPAAPAPHPAVVLVHGPGRVIRSQSWLQAMAAVLVAEGFSVLVFDKRGTGASGGEYVGEGARDVHNVSPQNLALLAADAAAAVDLLAERQDIDKTRIGLLGISQAGWIMPIAAGASPQVAFVVSASGPSVSTRHVDVWSTLLANGGAPAPVSLEQADAVLKQLSAPCAEPDCYDPTPSLAGLKVPALFLFGALDTSVPIAASLRVLEELRPQHDFEVELFAEAGHELYAVPRDRASETLRSSGFHLDLLPRLRGWLHAKVLERTPEAAQP